MSKAKHFVSGITLMAMGFYVGALVSKLVCLSEKLG